MISLVKIRELDIDDDFSLRGWTLQKAIDVSTKIDLLHHDKLLEKNKGNLMDTLQLMVPFPPLCSM